MKKYVINISASTEWAAAVAVLIYSLKINLKIYNECDIKVQYNNLSDNAKHLIKKVDSSIIFEKPKNSNFHKTMKQSIYGNKGHDVLLCFEAFWQDKYERSLYLDADMLCVNDFSEILTKNNKGFQWKNGNAGMFVVGKDILGEFSYNKLIETYTSKYTNNKMADQATIMHLYKDNCSTLNENYNFQRWGSGGDGSNEEFLNKINSLKIIHFSGRRKPWGKAHNLIDDNDKNCMSFPFMCFHSDAVKLWLFYYEQFKVNYVFNKSPIEQYEYNNQIIFQDLDDNTWRGIPIPMKKTQ